MAVVRPPALRRGDKVAVVSPAGPFNPKRRPDLDRGLERLRAWGLVPELAPHALAVHPVDELDYLAGSDEDRLGDFQAALDDGEVRAIFCVRGGYGCARLLAGLDWTKFRAAPKVVLGYSDVTALLSAIYREGVVGFHGPMVATSRGLAMGEAAAEQQRKLLFDGSGAPDLPPVDDGVAHVLVAGRAQGPLVGGNLSLVASLVGTPWAVDGTDALVFLEDIDERPYAVDRMLTQLIQAGTLAGAKGILLGDFRFGEARGEAMRRAMTPVFRACLDRLKIPVAFGFPFGHRARSWTLPVGIEAALDGADQAAPATLRLIGPAVR